MTGSGGGLAGAQDAFLRSFVPENAGRIRVVATDVDGTLTNSDGLITAETLRALARLRDHPAGARLILVTGRPAAAVQGLLIYTGFPNGIIIAENGAVIVSSPGAAAHVLAPLKTAHGPALLGYFQERALPMREAEDNADRLSDLTFIPAAAARTHATMEQLARRVEHAIAEAPTALGFPPLRVQFSTVHVHVGSAVADKGSALQAVLRGRAPGFPIITGTVHDLVCIGDSANDLAMFETFPERAVAIPGRGQTLDPALAPVTTYAAPAIADEGFAAVIDALFPAAG